MRTAQATTRPPLPARPVQSGAINEDPAPCSSLRDLLETLSMVAGPVMTQRQAQRLAGALDMSQTVAQRMAHLVEGIGVLVSGEALSRELGRAPTGALQDPRSMASMLYLIGHTFELVSGLHTVGAEALERVDALDRAGPAA